MDTNGSLVGVYTYSVEWYRLEWLRGSTMRGVAVALVRLTKALYAISCSVS